MENRDRAKTRIRRNHTHENLSEYKQLRYLTNHATSCGEKEVYTDFISSSANNTQLQKYLNITNNVQYTYTSQQSKDSNIMKDYFIDSFPPQSNSELINNYKNFTICNSEFPFGLVTKSTVLDMLAGKRNIFPGTVGLSISFLKMNCPYFLTFLVNIINDFERLSSDLLASKSIAKS